MKTEGKLETNLCYLFTILMSQCDSDTKSGLENMTEYSDVEAELDSMKLLGMIKKLVYIGGTNDNNKSHNKSMAHMNLMNLHQNRFQDIQYYHDQYIAMRKVCKELMQTQ